MSLEGWPGIIFSIEANEGKALLGTIIPTYTQIVGTILT